MAATSTAGGLARGRGGLVLVVATALVSGVSTFVNFYAVKGTNSDAFVTMRNLTTALFLLPVAAAGGVFAAGRLRGVDWARLAVIGLVGGAIPFLLYFRGLELAAQGGGAATASFAYRTLFLLAAVGAIVYLRERVSWRITLAAVLLLAGNALLLSLTTPLWTDGTGYVLVATAMWAGEYTLSKRTLRDLPSGTVALGRMGFGAMFLVGYLALTAQVGAIGRLSGAQWDWMLVSAVLLTAFVGTWYAGLRRVDLSVATCVLVLGFPVTWLLGVLFQGDPFLLAQAAGAVVVAVGVGVAVGRSALVDGWRSLVRRFEPRPDA